MDTVVVALRVALSLAAVLGLLWVLQRRLTKSARGGRSANLVTVVGRQGLGQKASVVVVDIEGRRFVLGVTEQSVSVLHTGEQTDAPADFARELADAGRGDAELAPPFILRPRRDRPAPGRLAGSILSPATWQHTAAALRQNR
ncbi:flagellar biosynthetic protein FliO [Cryobacterium sp. TmT2-59]|uniref:Flagellar protein n=1 Tax=Cryobacterium shii TaxID=1259235 RepID=A0AAQ2HGN5_9MICO|nr:MULTISPECIES: flagellar biosynthetic protein FliO [Cryobacterium]TFC52094.1 flagellar biosynthetic protein FliO [Cryobacterium shii]TFC84647.1 flagellar biosynthetic protein FliO [Cryobacterium sp. TmT2-59]TFD16240.1 flagellar biosynthetic protein FliO [Cryobacterium sp. TMT2-23]TFD19043.1 flagellar biosynthetic protein FliO [Cryobacterium sp. TMT4-10]